MIVKVLGQGRGPSFPKETNLSKAIHRTATRRCPGCGKVSSYQTRSETCDPSCALRIRYGKGPLIDETFEKKVCAFFEKSIKDAKGGKISLADLCLEFDRSPQAINTAVESLVNQGFGFQVVDGEYKLSREVTMGTRNEAVKIYHKVEDYNGGWRKFGACGDFHFGSLHERIDVVHSLYDIYESEGCTEVFNTGNWIEGECRLNYGDIGVFGMDDQIAHALKHWPRKEGMITYFVAGDDHEGWWQKSTRIVIGRHFEQMAREAGRDDLRYIGYQEGHVEFPTKEGKAHMIVMHPGGGSAYAESYAPQKIAECVPLDAEILTRVGWKKHDQLTLGEPVLGYDLRTGRCDWTSLDGVNVYADQEIVEYKNDQFVVECTRNHRWVMHQHRRAGPNPNSVNPQPYKKVSECLTTIDAAAPSWVRSFITQAAPGPEGPGASFPNRLDIIDRAGAVEIVLEMTRAQRQAFIFGMMVGEGSLGGAGFTPMFTQNPGPVHDAFIVACVLEGQATGISRHCRKNINGDVHTCLRTTLLKKPYRQVNSLRETASRRGPVWCPTTGLGTWVMRQGDIVTLTGNSFQEGEKPDICLLGHYHKMNYGLHRGIHMVQTGTCQDQSSFMRKQKIKAAVGGTLVEMNQAPEGHINRFKPEFFTYFDRGFYGKARRHFLGNEKDRTVVAGPGGTK